MLGVESEGSRVEVDVISHEAGDEVVGVIIERLHPDRHRVVGRGSRSQKVLRLQLLLQERVRSALRVENGM